MPVLPLPEPFRFPGIAGRQIKGFAGKPVGDIPLPQEGALRQEDFAGVEIEVEPGILRRIEQGFHRSHDQRRMRCNDELHFPVGT